MKGKPHQPTKASIGHNDKDHLIPLANRSVTAEQRKEREKRLEARRKIEQMEEQKELDTSAFDKWFEGLD